MKTITTLLIIMTSLVMQASSLNVAVAASSNTKVLFERPAPLRQVQATTADAKQDARACDSLKRSSAKKNKQRRMAR